MAAPKIRAIDQDPARAGAKWGDYIEGLLRPKLKVSEDDLGRVLIKRRRIGRV